MNMQKTEQEIERISGQLTEANRLFLAEVDRRIKESEFNGPAAREALLDTARQMLKHQKLGQSFLEPYGYNPEVYAAELLSDLEMRRPRTTKDKVKYYTMIPWLALTWVFFIYMVLGFFSKWSKGGQGEMTINTTSLLLIAAGSILLVVMITRFLGSPDKEKNPGGQRTLKADIKTFVLSIGAAVVIIAFYIMLRQMLPSFTVSPWTSLIIFAVGFVGQFYFLRRPRRG
ncbi:DUF1129 family protein [Paenibacillus physcomitrellae]|uniref:DUF1129 family protein n=1 Tax=Paenibacillus physcomitrellae TaxID=1619311 RepID=A0ABQ1GXZ6_9BACL|nr:DUF1129 family protein [Paenibacillus physcomitrellae]GGA52134.1 hypothetical protein GCM10010917_41720 [Paenibacillus physcomitrellae]